MSLTRKPDAFSRLFSSLATSPLATSARATASRRRGLLAGALVLGLAGALGAQTVIPGQYALADPVRVEAPAPQDFSAVVAAVKPAVVSVKVRSEASTRMMSDRSGGIPGFEDLPEDHPFRRFFRRFGEEPFGMTPDRGPRREQRPRQAMSQGSGFFITADGYVVTNEHVVDGGTAFTVVTDDGTEHEARLIGADARTDIALLKIDGKADFPYVEFADTPPMVGEWVVAVGNPFGLGGSVTAGIVSARGRDIGAGPYDDFIQIDAPVNRGNSGGPAFNVRGQVIGINAAIYSPSGGNVGIAFAIPASTATTIVEALKEGGTVVRGWLGVQIQPVSQDIADSIGLAAAKGAIVAEAQDDSPAAKAGVRSGDTILSVDGEPIESPRDLARKIASYPPDTTVTLGVWRDGGETTVQVRLGRLEDRPSVAALDQGNSGRASAMVDSLGLELASAARTGAAERGVVITDVAENSPALDKGLKRGDVILEVAGRQVETPADVADAVLAASESGRRAVLMRVETDGTTRFVAVPVERG